MEKARAVPGLFRCDKQTHQAAVIAATGAGPEITRLAGGIRNTGKPAVGDTADSMICRSGRGQHQAETNVVAADSRIDATPHRRPDVGWTVGVGSAPHYP